MGQAKEESRWKKLTAKRAEELAKQYLVGSVCSSWNHFAETGPAVIDRAADCRVWDTEGREYIDWIMGWGSLILGHRPEAVHAGIMQALESGFGYMYESPRSGLLSSLICEMVPSADKVRLCNSGLEATLYALRLARAATGRRKILKFEGHFHGLNDYLLFGVDSASQLGEMCPDHLVQPVAGSAGLPAEELSGLVIVVPFNDANAVTAAFEQHGDDLAGVILEPVALNVGCIAPEKGFLQFLRDICNIYGTLLIFDEILTGFRLAAGGAQELFGVLADLTCLGKALGCGMPVAALCGRAKYMDYLSPVGQVQMAGTNTGRHMTVCGTIAALEGMQEACAWDRLRILNDRFVSGCRQVFSHQGVPAYVEGFGGRIGIHIGSEVRPSNFREVVSLWNRSYYTACYKDAYYNKGLFGFMLPLGICPEPVTLSVLHDEAVIDETLNRLEDIVRAHPYYTE